MTDKVFKGTWQPPHYAPHFIDHQPTKLPNRTTNQLKRARVLVLYHRGLITFIFLWFRVYLHWRSRLWLLIFVILHQISDLIVDAVPIRLVHNAPHFEYKRIHIQQISSFDIVLRER